MSGFVASTCPHCQTASIVDLDTSLFDLLDTHTTKKATSLLQEDQFDREYFCDRCHKNYYIALRRKAHEVQK
jgi:hypothetical protein